MSGANVSQTGSCNRDDEAQNENQFRFCISRCFSSKIIRVFLLIQNHLTAIHRKGNSVTTK